MQKQVGKKLDFSDQNIYVGLYTHKKQITVGAGVSAGSPFGLTYMNIPTRGLF